VRGARKSCGIYNGDDGAVRYILRPIHRKERSRELSEFSGDEVFACFVSIIGTGAGALRYYGGLIGVSTLGGGLKIRGILAVAPLICLALLLPVLLHLTAHEVKEDHAYVVMFMLAGCVWLWLSVAMAAALGISFRDDAIERRNYPAAVAICGAMLGVTCVYAGANIGEGATVWMTFAPAAMATVAWVANWLMLEWMCGIDDAVAIERDMPSAVRLAVFLAVSGAILGWAVAGDFESAEGTVRDLAWRGWPVVPLAMVLAIVQSYAVRRRQEGE